MRSLAAISIGGLLAAATLLAPARAAGAGGDDVRPAVTTAKATAHAVPAGDFRSRIAAPSARRAMPRRIPVGEAALVRLKALAAPATSDDGGEAVKEAARDGRRGEAWPRGGCDVNLATGFAPADVHGAVGEAALVVVSNADIGVYSRTRCAVVARQSLRAFFAASGAAGTEMLFDPRVIHDRRTGRFFVTAVSRDARNRGQFQYFAVSQDPSGTRYALYRLSLSGRSGAACQGSGDAFWDFPNAGANASRWLVTANETGARAAAAAILSIDKAATLAGAPAAVRCFRATVPNIAPPIVLDTSDVATFLSVGSGSGATIRRLNLTASPAGPAADALSEAPPVRIPAWTAPPDALQPNGQRLETHDGRFPSASIQSRGLVWNVHAVNIGGFSRIRLYKLAQAAAVTAPLMTFAPFTTRGEHLFAPSLATASGAFNAPIFITASRTVPAIAAGTKGNAALLMFQGLNSSANPARDWRYDILGTSAGRMTGCGERARGTCRWGDYSATQVDPLASERAFGFGQLVAAVEAPDAFDWLARAGGVALDPAVVPGRGD
jgi:hypothetical protein